MAVEKGVMSETPANPDPSVVSVRQKRLFSHRHLPAVQDAVMQDEAAGELQLRISSAQSAREQMLNTRFGSSS